jgi:hypothetical protein
MKLKELITHYLASRGVQEAAAVRVAINGEEPLVITSERHPELEREVGDGSGVTLALLQSAKAGLSNGVVDRYVKTDISVSSDLLDRAEAVAHEMKISRSKLVSLALEEFFQRRQTRELVESINQAYQAGPDEEDREWLRLSQQAYRKVLEKEDEW